MKMAVEVEESGSGGYSLLVLKDDEKTIWPVISTVMRTDVCLYIQRLINEDQQKNGHKMQKLRGRDSW